MPRQTVVRIMSTLGLVLPISCFSASAAMAEDLVFTLNNDTSSALTEFYVSKSESKTWEENILTHAIAPGASAEVTIADGETVCGYDIKGVFKDGSDLEEQGLDLCKLGSYTYSED